ncbi:hypothetical protein QBC44DRAFT_59881 [Cladorrhinum sp. PSN332]|nr:hypothetical protein QBC44DRAFT_59881 [Cladorrhinum sp. PSN332]
MKRSGREGGIWRQPNRGGRISVYPRPSAGYPSVSLVYCDTRKYSSGFLIFSFSFSFVFSFFPFFLFFPSFFFFFFSFFFLTQFVSSLKVSGDTKPCSLCTTKHKLCLLCSMYLCVRSSVTDRRQMIYFAITASVILYSNIKTNICMYQICI